MEKVILLEITIGTLAVAIFLIIYTRMIKGKLRKNILRYQEMQKYIKER